jgi:hypothetical protein
MRLMPHMNPMRRDGIPVPHETDAALWCAKRLMRRMNPMRPIVQWGVARGEADDDGPGAPCAAGRRF